MFASRRGGSNGLIWPAEGLRGEGVSAGIRTSCGEPADQLGGVVQIRRLDETSVSDLVDGVLDDLDSNAANFLQFMRFAYTYPTGVKRGGQRTRTVERRSECLRKAMQSLRSSSTCSPL